MNHCNLCEVYNTILSCYCDTGAGYWQTTSIDMSECISCVSVASTLIYVTFLPFTAACVSYFNNGELICFDNQAVIVSSVAARCASALSFVFQGYNFS